MKIKKASIDLTIGKLISLIMLVIILSLVTYGVASGRINPLFEKAEGTFNSILGFSGQDTPNADKLTREVSIVVGKDALGKDEVWKGKLTLSGDGKWCKVDFNNEKGSYQYNFKTGKFNQWVVVYDFAHENPTGSGSYGAGPGGMASPIKAANVDYNHIKFDFARQKWQWSVDNKTWFNPLPLDVQEQSIAGTKFVSLSDSDNFAGIVIKSLISEGFSSGLTYLDSQVTVLQKYPQEKFTLTKTPDWADSGLNLGYAADPGAYSYRLNNIKNYLYNEC